MVVTRRWHQSTWKWADVIAPGLFVMQAIGRWGNFFNQELYGPPTTLPWGIAIDCAHRIVAYPCTTYPVETTGFQPLFLYESLSGVLGAITLLWIARRYGPRMRPGDLLLIFFIWYAVVRFMLETLRSGNWTFFGAPTAMLISGALIAGSLLVLAIRHRPGSTVDRWGDPPEPGRDEAADGDDDEEYEDDDADEAGFRLLWRWPMPCRSRARPPMPDQSMSQAATTWTRTTTRNPMETTPPASLSTLDPDPGRQPEITPPQPADARPADPAPGVAPSVDPPPTKGPSPAPAGSRRRRPPPSRLAPDAIASARGSGGAREGLDWLGRRPEARASLLYRALRLLARFVIFVVFRFRVTTSGQELLPRGGYLLSVPHIAAGWIRSW